MEYEDYQYLDIIIDQIEKEGMLKDHRVLPSLTKWPNSVRGRGLVDWFMNHRYASSIEAAVAMGQRLLDASLILPCTATVPNAPAAKNVFANTRHCYVLRCRDPAYKERELNKGRRYELEHRPDYVSGSLDLQGTWSIGTIHAILTTDNQTLQFFRSHLDNIPRDVITNLKETVSYFIALTGSEGADFEAARQRSVSRPRNDSVILDGSARSPSPAPSSPAPPQPRPLTRLGVAPSDHSPNGSPAQSSRTLSVPVTNGASSSPITETKELKEKDSSEATPDAAVGPPFAYLHLYCTRPSCYYRLRLESSKDKEKWEAAFKKMGCRVRDESEVKDDIDAKIPLDLRVVLATPNFRAAFSQFLAQALALENLKFLEAVDAYKAINDNDERKVAATHIYEAFIVKDAPDMVNLDAATLNSLVDRYNQNMFRKNIFDAAYSCIYKMTARDVYMRFVQSSAYTEMVAAANATSRARAATTAKAAPSSNGSPNTSNVKVVNGRRIKLKSAQSMSMTRSQSFIIPVLDDLKQLFGIATKMQHHEGLLGDRRKGFSKYEKCCEGSAIVDWLIKMEYTSIRPAAEAIAQRLVDSGLLRHVKSSDVIIDFSDNDELFTFEPLPELEKALSASELRNSYASRKDLSSDQWHDCQLLMKGAVKYYKAYAILNQKDRVLHMYRTQQANKPFRIINLKNCKWKTETREAKPNDSAMNLGDDSVPASPAPLSPSPIAQGPNGSPLPVPSRPRGSVSGIASKFGGAVILPPPPQAPTLQLPRRNPAPSPSSSSSSSAGGGSGVGAVGGPANDGVIRYLLVDSFVFRLESEDDMQEIQRLLSGL